MNALWPSNLPLAIVNHAGTAGWGLHIPDALSRLSVAPESVVDLTDLGMGFLHELDQSYPFILMLLPSDWPIAEARTRVGRLCPRADIRILAIGPGECPEADARLVKTMKLQVDVNNDRVSKATVTALKALCAR